MIQQNITISRGRLYYSSILYLETNDVKQQQYNLVQLRDLLVNVFLTGGVNFL